MEAAGKKKVVLNLLIYSIEKLLRSWKVLQIAIYCIVVEVNIAFGAINSDFISIICDYKRINI